MGGLGVVTMDRSKLILTVLTLSEVWVAQAFVSTQGAHMLGLCIPGDPSCVELAVDEWCTHRSSEQSSRFNSQICSPQPSIEESNQLSRCVDSLDPLTSLLEEEPPLLCAQDCASQAEANWPQLSYSLIHVNADYFNVSINWRLPPGVNVSGYSLLVSLYPWSCNVNSEVYLQCGVNDLPGHSTGFIYSHTRGYHRGETFPGLGTHETIHIKLIPNGWCDGPQISLETPESCHNVCPGACSLCGTSGSSNKVSPPANLAASLCRSPYTGIGVVSVTWQPGEIYYKPYPNQTYYVAVFKGESSLNDVVSRHIEVVGKTSVVLYNLSLITDQTYHIRVWPYDCRCGIKSSKVKFTISEDTPLCTHNPDHSNSSAVSQLVISPKSSINAGMSSTTSLHAISSTVPHPLPSTHPLTLSTTVPHPLPSTYPLTPSTTLPHPSPNTHPLTPSTTLPHPPPTNHTLTSSTTLPHHPQPTQAPQLQWFSIVIPIIALSLVLVLFLISVIVCCAQRQPFKHPPPSSTESPPTPKPHRVDILLVYSLRTPLEDEECIMENFVKPLSLYGIRVLFYDVACGREGIPQWMETSVAQSSKVFLVCNPQFKKEWEDGSCAPLGGNLIHVLKLNFFACIHSSPDSMSKFALLFLRTKSVETCIASNYLHNLKKFLINDPSDPTWLEQVVRFIRSCSTYTLPD